MVLLRATSAATRDLRLKVISERPVILASKCRALGKRGITTYFNDLGLSGARTYCLSDAKRERYHKATATGKH
jgi:hypothetical protein